MRYLVVVQMMGSSPVERLKEDVPTVVSAIDKASRGEREAFFRSSNGTLFGFFLKSDLEAGAIRGIVDGSTGIRSGDSVLVIEVGDDFSGVGFGRAGTWLQHHKAK